MERQQAHECLPDLEAATQREEVSSTSKKSTTSKPKDATQSQQVACIATHHGGPLARIDASAAAISGTRDERRSLVLQRAGTWLDRLVQEWTTLASEDSHDAATNNPAKASATTVDQGDSSVEMNALRERIRQAELGWEQERQKNASSKETVVQVTVAEELEDEMKAMRIQLRERESALEDARRRCAAMEAEQAQSKSRRRSSSAFDNLATVKSPNNGDTVPPARASSGSSRPAMTPARVMPFTAIGKVSDVPRRQYEIRPWGNKDDGFLPISVPHRDAVEEDQQAVNGDNEDVSDEAYVRLLRPPIWQERYLDDVHVRKGGSNRPEKEKKSKGRAYVEDDDSSDSGFRPFIRVEKIARPRRSYPQHEVRHSRFLPRRGSSDALDPGNGSDRM